MLQHRPNEESATLASRPSSLTTERIARTQAEATPETLTSLIWDNPMLAKEIRRSRREEWAAARTLIVRRFQGSMIQGLIFSAIGLGAFESQIVPRLSDGEPRVAWLVLFGTIALIQAVAALVGTGGVGARVQGERMKQTWSAVLLTRLTPAQLVVGKVGAAILPGLFAALSLVPAALWCAVRSGEPGAALSALALWPTILVATALTALLSIRVALRGSQPRRGKGGFLGAAAGAYWMGAPVLAQILGTAGMLVGGVLSYLGVDVAPLQLPAAILFGAIVLPLAVVNPFVALIAALPWAWPDPNTAALGTLIRVALVLIHLGFAANWTRKAWKSALADVPRSQPDITAS